MKYSAPTAYTLPMRASLCSSAHHLVAVQRAVASQQVGELGRVDAAFVEPGLQALPELLVGALQGRFVAGQAQVGPVALQRAGLR